MVNVCLTREVFKKTRENISKLSFFSQKSDEIGTCSNCFRCHINDKVVIVVYHFFFTITQVKYALFAAHCMPFPSSNFGQFVLVLVPNILSFCLEPPIIT